MSSMQDGYLTAFARLKTIMDELREQCPWDRKQTIHSLRQMTIEETYELADAITEDDWKGIKEELGDLLLHILFYGKIAEEQGQFQLEDMINDICAKLINRHPHIYGDVQVKDEEEVKRNWEKIKMQEGKTSVLSGVPVSLPAMVKALRLQEKAKQVGFEWDHIDQVWDKVREELEELREVIQASPDLEDGLQSQQNRQLRVEEEFGDLLFSLVNYSRFLKIDPELALERTNKKFMRRFVRMEQMAALDGRNLRDMSLVEMDQLWNNIKTEETA